MARFVHDEERSSPLAGTDNGGENIIGPNSRPHSSTSAELESGINALTVQPQIVQPPVPIRTKETRYVFMKICTVIYTVQQYGFYFLFCSSRYKSKRQYPSIPNQPSEASAHFMCELAKTVLSKAGGTSSTSLFTQPSTSQNHHGPHRALHMCAFQLGLYALGLHNCVSPNWLSRTYSSHVSWITGQAMEIGAPAIWFLIDSWDGHLTPPEAVSIADKSSRGSDPNMVRAAAELALSCLPHAHALNPNEIQRAISQVCTMVIRYAMYKQIVIKSLIFLQCKEQSEAMLEKACITVENTAKGGGVYPEVLFQVAKYWYELYLRVSSNKLNRYLVM